MLAIQVQTGLLHPNSNLDHSSSPSSSSSSSLTQGTIAHITTMDNLTNTPALIVQQISTALEANTEELTGPIASTSSVTLDTWLPSSFTLLHQSETNHDQPSQPPPPPPFSNDRKPSLPRLIVKGQVIASSAQQLGLSGGRPKKFICTQCGKGYTRPVRLQEHERVHTGERPFHCTECPSTFTRDSHLKAHFRIHSGAEQKRYDCDQCDKKFWTSQHVKKHVEVVHQGKTYDCFQCDESFRKHHQLRTHVAEVHSTPGTFPFICEHEDCDKSFKQKTHLTAHLRTHDLSRYMCGHADCAALPLSERQHPTWTALQKHTKSVHPPTCPHPECANKTFTTSRGLRNHLSTVHEHSNAEQETSDTRTTKRKRRRGTERRRRRPRKHSEEDEAEFTDEVEQQTASEWEREDEERETRMLHDFAIGGKKKRALILAPESVWACGQGSCTKTFKSAVALEKHREASHSATSRSVPYVEIPIRQRSRSKTPRALAHQDEDENDDDDTSLLPLPPLPELPKKKDSKNAAALIDLITGHGYAPSTRDPSSNSLVKRLYACPWPAQIDLLKQFASNAFQYEQETLFSRSTECEYRFSRVYDAQRHLKSQHGIDVDLDALYDWYEEEHKNREGTRC